MFLIGDEVEEFVLEGVEVANVGMEVTEEVKGGIVSSFGTAKIELRDVRILNNEGDMRPPRPGANQPDKLEGRLIYSGGELILEQTEMFNNLGRGELLYVAGIVTVRESNIRENDGVLFTLESNLVIESSTIDEWIVNRSGSIETRA